jgi:DnaJ homolog subfamily C member 17
MDRSTRKDYDWLLERKQTAYELLDIKPSAIADDIRKAYRKKALALHPDKNREAGSEEKFREVNVSYEILSNETTRGEYDEYLRKRKDNTRPTPEVNSKIFKFKSDLKERENHHKSEKLSEAARKQKIEQLSKWYDAYVKEHSYGKRSTPKNPVFIDEPSVTFPTKTVLKWKNRSGVIFDEDLITKLMGIFGTVVEVHLDERNKPENAYHYAFVYFKSPIASALATTHNFSETADYWDSMNLRKVSSLLRSVKLIGYDYRKFHDINTNKISSLDYIAVSIMDSMKVKS